MKNIKSRFKYLKEHPARVVWYVILCVVTFLCLTILPLFLWMSSDVETRGFLSVRGNSMMPTIKNNDILYVAQPTYERGEIIVFESPYVEDYYITSDLYLLKRVVGLPGELVEITENGILINGELLEETYTDDQNNTLQDNNKFNELILSDNEYFLLGDNRDESLDSRYVGAIEASRFVYALTTEPNPYTQKIMMIVLIIAIINFCLIVFSPFVWLVLLTDKKKKK